MNFKGNNTIATKKYFASYGMATVDRMIEVDKDGYFTFQVVKSKRNDITFGLQTKSKSQTWTYLLENLMTSNSSKTNTNL